MDRSLTESSRPPGRTTYVAAPCLRLRRPQFGSSSSNSAVRHYWTRGVAWLTHLLVTEKIAGSNPVGSAN